MSYKLTNISGSPVVCDLAIAGKTLRLNNKQSKTIKDTEITPHINTMIEKRLLLGERVSQETQIIKKTTTKSSNKKKEE